MVQDSHIADILDKEPLADTADASLEEKRKKVGNYVILKTIGEGSFAKVRLGIHLITEMKVAVKVINKREVFKRNYLRTNLRREASMMQRMSHSNIVQLHEVMETENSYYIVMDLVQGNEFVKYLTNKKQLDENETRKYIRQIVSAVDHMHRAHVIHRDIKLQNFMLNQNNDIIIIDFGLSNSLDEKDFLTTQCGSPAYAAPEIFAHQEYGPAVDVWSIGVNMYAMLLGKLPFKVENRSRNLAKLHACILKGCEIPNILSSECHDLLTRLLDPSPTKRITMPEILRHPFLVRQAGPIALTPYKPHGDTKELNRNIIRYLAFKYGYSEHEVEDAVLYRKPTASRALYNLIERRLKEGLGWPDRKYNNSMTANASSISTGMSAADGPSDVGAPDKLVRHEPLLPGRRTPSHLASQQSSPSMIHARQFSRERSTYASDQQVLLQSNAIGRSITAGLTRETLNESEPQSRLTSRRLFHDIVARKPSAVGHSIDSTDESQGTRRLPHSSGLVPLKPLTPHHGPMLGIPQLKPVTPRTLRHSTLEHVHPPSVHLASELPVGISNDVRTPKIFRRTTHAESMRQTQQHSPVRYNPSSSVTVKAIGLFLKNSALHSRVGSCSSKSSKTTGCTTSDAQPDSPPGRIYSPTMTSDRKQATMNYRSQAGLRPTRQTVLNTSGSPRYLSTNKSQHAKTAGMNEQKLMPT